MLLLLFYFKFECYENQLAHRRKGAEIHCNCYYNSLGYNRSPELRSPLVYVLKPLRI